MTDPAAAAPAPEPVAGSPKRNPLTGLMAGSLAGALIAGGLAGFVVSRLTTAQGSCDVVRLTTSTLPAVVTVYAENAREVGSGSGAIISRDGAIVTNDHVIATAGDSGRITVLLNSGVQLPATLVGTDPRTDLAVLKVDGTRLPTLSFGDDTALRVGQPVVALGAPLGLSGTVTSGIVSALDRDIVAPVGNGGTTVLAGSIQTDASINPGNSGGPLVDCAGRLVGVNTAISTVPDASGVASGGSVGIGFAVPAGTVRRITDQLRSDGQATHPSMGIALAEVPPAVAQAFGGESGLYVQAVAEEGPAAQAGVQAGDLIVTIAGSPATSFAFGRMLARSEVGDEVELDLIRGGERQRVTVVLAEAGG